jgi:hypothetical protein
LGIARNSSGEDRASLATISSLDKHNAAISSKPTTACHRAREERRTVSNVTRSRSLVSKRGPIRNDAVLGGLRLSKSDDRNEREEKHTWFGKA